MELPELAIGPTKAKVDTGARTNALQGVQVDVFDRDGSTWVLIAHEHEDGSVGTVNEAPVLELRDGLIPEARASHGQSFRPELNSALSSS